MKSVFSVRKLSVPAPTCNPSHADIVLYLLKRIFKFGGGGLLLDDGGLIEPDMRLLDSLLTKLGLSKVKAERHPFASFCWMTTKEGTDGLRRGLKATLSTWRITLSRPGSSWVRIHTTRSSWITIFIPSITTARAATTRAPDTPLLSG